MDSSEYKKVPTEDINVFSNNIEQSNEFNDLTEELKIHIDSEPQSVRLDISSPNSDNTSVRLHLDQHLLTSSREGLNTSSTLTSHTHVCTWNKSERRQARLNTKLLELVVNGNCQSVLDVLKTGANPNAKCRRTHISALHIAVLMGFTDIVQELLRRRADTETTDVYGRNPVHFAAYCGNTECLKLLLEYNINYVENNDDFSEHINDLINKQCTEREEINKLPRYMTDSWGHDCKSLENLIPFFEPGSTPLHIACQNCHTDFIRELLNAGADTSLEDNQGYQPLNNIGQNIIIKINAKEENVDLSCFLDSVKLMLNSNAGYNESCTEPTFYPTPLHTATVLDHVEAIKFILSKNVNLESFDLDGHTAIHISVLHENDETLRPLLEALAQRQINVDLRNRYGSSSLQLAIEKQWAAGISALLEANADVQVTSLNGDTALHKAASTSNVNLLDDILEIPTARSIINVRNHHGETPLFCAIKSGCLKCVQALLNFDADVTVELPNQITILHRTAEYGHVRILSELLKAIKEDRVSMINKRDTLPMSGMTALHMAAHRNKLECVRVLLEAKADPSIVTTPVPHNSAIPLHLAASEGHAAVVDLLLEYDPNTITIRNKVKCNALHLAAQAGQRDCIKVLLKHNGDLSAPLWDEIRCCTETTIQMILNNVSRPTEFLEEIFDSCITTNEYLENDPNCTIEVKYDILTSSEGSQQMRIVKAIINTGNRFGQKRILLHPVIESFLYLKWQALCPLFYIILIMYIIFVLSVTCYASTLYYFKENMIKTSLLLQKLSLSTLYLSLCLIIPQELLHAYQNFGKYLMDLETWIKWSTFILSLTVSSVDHNKTYLYDWPRHVTAITVLLVWLELMFLLSRFPDWGYYVLMFFKVANNIVKVLMTFAFLVIGFSFSFLIEFQAYAPFSNPWEAFIKTIVMMTSEFEYSDLFNSSDEKENWESSNIIGRIIFIVFVILASIVLMNLMIGLAVSDINDLEIQGKIRRLEKHIEFLCALDGIVVNRWIIKVQKSICLQNIHNDIHITNGLTLHPGKSSSNQKISLLLKEQIFEKAVEKHKKKDECTLKTLKNDVEEIKNIIKNYFTHSNNLKKHSERDTLQEKHLTTVLNEINTKINAFEEQMNSPRPKILENSEKLENIEKNIYNIHSKFEKVLDKLNLN